MDDVIALETERKALLKEAQDYINDHHISLLELERATGIPKTVLRSMLGLRIGRHRKRGLYET